MKNEKKLSKIDSLFDEFSTPEKASKLVELQHFEKFKDASEALTSVTSLVEGKMSKKLKKALKKISHDDVLGVADAKLGTVIKDKFSIECQATDAVQKLMACIRSQLPALVPEWSAHEESAMQLAISHGLVLDPLSPVAADDVMMTLSSQLNIDDITLVTTSEICFEQSY